ncbi:unnamed protein product, partial [Prorocentrum cordatum]
DAPGCWRRGDFGECLLRVRVKDDPWACYRGLVPVWARTAAWVHCCGGSGRLAAKVMLAPCPEMQCCSVRPLSADFKRSAVMLLWDGSSGALPAWLTCESAPDDRWRRLRQALEGHTAGDRAGDAAIELAQELLATVAGPEGQATLARFRGAYHDWGLGPTPEFCLAGYAAALYAVGAAAPGLQREWNRLLLQQLLNVGYWQSSEMLPLAWVLDMSGWPLSAAEVVNFALTGALGTTQRRGVPGAALATAPPGPEHELGAARPERGFGAQLRHRDGAGGAAICGREGRRSVDSRFEVFGRFRWFSAVS